MLSKFNHKTSYMLLGCWLFQKFPFKWPQKTKIINRIIQSKMIPIQDQFFWAWTGIQIVCRNIGPLSSKFSRIHEMLSKSVALVDWVSVFSATFSERNLPKGLENSHPKYFRKEPVQQKLEKLLMLWCNISIVLCHYMWPNLMI